MKFCILSETEILQNALTGNRSYLDLLISMHEQFIIEHISRKTTTKPLLGLRTECIQYVHTHFNQSFDLQLYQNFSTWLLECIDAVCLEN